MLGLNGEFQFSFATYSYNATPFVINIISGDITLSRTLDREAISFYNLTLVVSDLGSPPLSSIVQLYVNISDVNDNSPLFILPPFADQFVFQVVRLI